MQKLPKHNYKAIEQDYNFSYYQDHLKIAQKLGYTYLCEGIIKEYRKLKSQRKVALVFEYNNRSIRYMLKRFKEPSQSQGGYRPGDIRYGRSKPAHMGPQ